MTPRCVELVAVPWLEGVAQIEDEEIWNLTSTTEVEVQGVRQPAANEPTSSTSAAVQFCPRQDRRDRRGQAGANKRARNLRASDIGAGVDKAHKELVMLDAVVLGKEDSSSV